MGLNLLIVPKNPYSFSDKFENQLHVHVYLIETEDPLHRKKASTITTLRPITHKICLILENGINKTMHCM